MPANGTDAVPFAEVAEFKLVTAYEAYLKTLPPAHVAQQIIRMTKFLNNDGALAVAKEAALKGTRHGDGKTIRNLYLNTDKKPAQDAQCAVAALQAALPKQKKK